MNSDDGVRQKTGSTHGMSDSPPEPKEDHVGVTAPALGPLVYLVVRHDGKILAIEADRHDAVGLRCVLDRKSVNDYELRCVPVGRVPLMDLGMPDL